MFVVGDMICIIERERLWGGGVWGDFELSVCGYAGAVGVYIYIYLYIHTHRERKRERLACRIGLLLKENGMEWRCIVKCELRTLKLRSRVGVR